MSLRITFALCCAVGIASSALAETPAQPKPAAPIVTSATSAAVIKSDALSIPTPGEFLAAVEKVAKTDWKSLYRKPIATTFTSRPQGALNLGGLIADGYLAVEAEDAQQVKNVGKDIISLATILGVNKEVMGRGSSISEFAERNEWNTLKEELEATQNEVKLALTEQGDDKLVTLVTLGGWIRGLEAVTTWIAANYTPEAAKLLRQPGIVDFLLAKVEALPEATRDDDTVKLVRKKLDDLKAAVTFPADSAPTVEQIKQLQALATEIAASISTKP